MFDFRKKELQSICDAPVLAMDPQELDARHPTAQFNLYWRSLASGQSPSWQQFNPMDVPSLLPWVMMFTSEPAAGRNRFHLGLQGASAAYLTHGSCQGKYLDEFVFEECYFTRHQMLADALDAQAPQYGKLLPQSKNLKHTVDVAVGAFPFADAGRVIMIPAPIREQDRAYL